MIIVEIIFIPGTTVVGIFGFLIGIYGIYRSYEVFGETTGHTVLVISVVIGFAAVIYSFKSGHWERFALSKTIDGKVNENLTKDLKVSERGHTVSALRPIGKAEFNDIEYEVTSLGNYIEQNVEIEIIKIDKNKIYVKPIKV